VALLITSILSALLIATSATDDGILHTAAELYDALSDGRATGRRFDLSITAFADSGTNSTFLAGEDTTGAMTFTREHAARRHTTVRAGDTLRIRGTIRLGARTRSPHADCEIIDITGHRQPQPPQTVSGVTFQSGQVDCRLVTVQGTVRDIVSDEIDPHYVFMLLRTDDDVTILVPLPCDEPVLGNLSPGFIVSVSGICSPFYTGGRRQLGRLLQITAPDRIRILSAIRKDPFDVPEIGRIKVMPPDAIARLGRHRATGRVLATWQGRFALMKTVDGNFARLELADGPLPRINQRIEAVGFPESDLYRLNLTRAHWRTADGASAMQPDATKPSRTMPITLKDGKRLFDPFSHGTLRQLTGIVRTSPTESCRFNLDCDGTPLVVDVSAWPEAASALPIGSCIEVTGICVMESDNWRPNLVFPKITEAILVIRSAGDIRILSKPSWWTPIRLLALIGMLLLALVVILVWNASLRILALRRGRELFKSQIAKVSSELRVSERTRLAVELHDSITQNLTGVTLQLDAAASAREEDPSAADALLGVARRTLQSSLDELRRCLWDLRSEALEEPDFNKAIRIALKQVAARADIAVRFNVNRAKLSDATAHAILRIIRELVSNAVRHGNATKIRIAGETLPDRIHFAVSDNGCGFNEVAIPGPGEGHFGIAGIRERLKDLHGTVNFTSSPEKGTRAEISILLPQLASAS